MSTDSSEERGNEACFAEINNEAENESISNIVDETNEVIHDNVEIFAAISDYTSNGNEQLSFKKGQVINVLQKKTKDWWWAEIDGCYGYVPTNHLISPSKYIWEDDEYFGSYANLQLHHEMLNDRPRTLAYEKAICDNAEQLKNKTVLEVGCGTGILSMMVAKYADPRKVYALEGSGMAKHAKQVIRENGLSDKIEVLHVYAEEASIDEQVDLIISEWMGTALLFEMMLESVIILRDRFLKPGGNMWPSSAQVFLVPCTAKEMYEERMDFWDNQYGFTFSCLKEVARTDTLSKPKYDYILPKEDCLSPAQSVINLDIGSVKVADLEEITSPFSFTLIKGGNLHGFCSWFDVDFSPLAQDAETVVLSTGPDKPLTHWKQDLFLLDEAIPVSKGDSLMGTIKFIRNPEWRRHLRVFVQFMLYSGATEQKQVVREVEKLFFIWK